MTIWIDGDSCPARAMDVLFARNGRKEVRVCIVADRSIQAAAEAGVASIILPHGSGEVDAKIIEESRSGDIAVTRDLELAGRLLAKNLTVLNDRGIVWDAKSLMERTEEAALMQAMKAGGLVNRSMPSYGPKDVQTFALSLDRILAAVS